MLVTFWCSRCAPVRRMYYTAGDGQDLSPLRTRAGPPAAAEPPRLAARGSPGVLRQRPGRSLGPVGDHEGLRGGGSGVSAVPSGDDDEGAGVCVLRGRLLVAPDPA